MDKVSDTMSVSFLKLVMIYSARQLRGITLLVPPICLSVGGNLCHYEYKAPDNT